MAKMLNWLITLPVLLVPVAFLSSGTATAEMVSPTDALEILAKSEAANAKCGVLIGSESTELRRYVARAEIAAVRRMGPEEANATVSSGRAAGRSVSCSGTASAEIYEVLNAARVAVAQVDGGRGTRLSLLPQKRSVRLSNPAEPTARMVASSQPIGSLSRFQQISTAYFIERRCRFLSNSRARNFWQSVLGAQSEAMAANSRGKVNAVLKQARAAADRSSCDARAARLVRSAYASLAAN